MFALTFDPHGGKVASCQPVNAILCRGGREPVKLGRMDTPAPGFEPDDGPSWARGEGSGLVVPSPQERDPGLRGLASYPLGWVLSGTIILGAAAVVGTYLLVGLLVEVSTNPISPAQRITASFAVATALGALVALVVNLRKQDLSEQTSRRELDAAFADRFASAAAQLGGESPAERIAGLYALATLADEYPSRRQQCVAVLCGYLRLPFDPELDHLADRSTSSVTFEAEGRQVTTYENPATRPHDRIVREAITTLIRDRTQPDSYPSWSKLDFDFTGAVFQSLDLSNSHFDGTVRFDHATFLGERTSFDNARFSGKRTSFVRTNFFGKTTWFSGATFSGEDTSFVEATFSASATWFLSAEFAGEYVSFHGAQFSSKFTSFQMVTFAGAHTRFDKATFSGAYASFFEATFSGEHVTFGHDKDAATFRNVQVHFDRVDRIGEKATARALAGVQLDKGATISKDGSTLRPREDEG